MEVWNKTRTMLSRFIPSHVNDPFGLVARMLRSKKKAAFFTLWVTGLGVLLTPIDWFLQRFERRAREAVDKSTAYGPHIIVCGPARSGTTLVYQVLSDTLDIAYIRNFTVMFSRSPILASKWLTRDVQAQKDKNANGYENYYGKTSGMQAPSEANHIWNQWVRSDASDFRTILDQRGARDMREFMTSFSASQSAPTLYKNNNANAFADVIADTLDNTYFICLRRETAYLAQSLIQARMEINGDIAQSYGVTNTSSDNDVNTDVNTGTKADNSAEGGDPVAEVIEQVEYLNKLAVDQQSRIGKERFWIIDYEDFCRDPSALVQRVRREILDTEEASNNVKLPSFTNNNKASNPALLQRIVQSLDARKS